MNIIFGGSGFIGKNLIKQINAEYQVYDIVKSDKNFNYCDIRMEIQIVLFIIWQLYARFQNIKILNILIRM